MEGYISIVLDDPVIGWQLLPDNVFLKLKQCIYNIAWLQSRVIAPEDSRYTLVVDTGR